MRISPSLKSRCTCIGSVGLRAGIAGANMDTVTGIFASASDAERATRRLQPVLGKDKVTLLVPGKTANPAESIEVAAAEQPGMGTAIGGVVGAALGMAGGVEVAAATALVPGVGPVIALGVLGGSLLGLLGAEVGQVLDRAADALPEDEVFVYEDALRRGRTVLVASANDESAASVRKLLAQEGAEAVDAARHQWWIGLRSAEQEQYSLGKAKFDRDEKFYRLGFETSLRARYRCGEYDQVLSEMQADIEELQRLYPGVDVEQPFRRGFERGRDYYQEICNAGQR
jgi:hypothetical protein